MSLYAFQVGPATFIFDGGMSVLTWGGGSFSELMSFFICLATLVMHLRTISIIAVQHRKRQAFSLRSVVAPKKTHIQIIPDFLTPCSVSYFG